ncbi:tetratricopeptide repeat protein [Paracoccaceae bacterium]|nr:tetratricopeptide repeat protein [Paracoccaceae bacterium]
MSYNFNTGTYSYKVTTKSGEAQLWFDRGLIWAYGFHWEEAVTCFKEAVKADPECAMAWWGVAYSVGPEYNRMWHQLDEIELPSVLVECFNASQKALELSPDVTQMEKDLINALSMRHPSSAVPENFDVWTNAYADAMRIVLKKYPEDPDVSALLAEAVISRTPWKLWDLNSGKPTDGASTLEAKDVLEKAIANVEFKGTHPHAGLLHYYIHVMEMSPTPEVALRAGDIMRTLVPDCGHLLHMPTHIDFQCGNYNDVVERNSEAIESDKKVIARDGNLNLFAGSVIHNIHFKLYGAMFMGNYSSSMDAIKQFDELVPNDLIRIKSPPMANLYEGYYGLKYHALIRFGKWQEIIDLKAPDDPDLFLVTTAIYRYARALAFAALGDVAFAIEEQKNFKEAFSKIPDERVMFNNKCIDLLKIADAMLNGEIEYRKNNFEVAFKHLNQAIKNEDTLPYDEPWGWMQPARHALGALLLEQGEIEKAEMVYKADLGFDSSLIRARRHPNNVWSLHGLAECLKRQDKQIELGLISQNLGLAMGRVDVPIKASCFCRLQHG